MANEFIIRKGFQSQADSQITGSLTVITGSNIEFQVLDTGVKIGNVIGDIHNVTGSFRVSGSITGSLLGTASYATQALSASFAPAGNPFPYTGSAIITGSLVVTGSVTVQSGSFLRVVNGLISASYGTNNVSVGDTPGWTSGARNVAFGLLNQGSVTTISDNTSMGYGALKGGASNTSLGAYSSNTATGTGNVTIGYYASANSSDISNYKVAIGYEAMFNVSASGDNHSVGIGYRALYWTRGIRNVAVGSSAGQNISTGTYNAVFGSNAGPNISTGGYNTALGPLAMNKNTSGSYNIAIGYDSGGSVLSSNDQDNILIGQNAGGDNTSTKQMNLGNIGIGYRAIYSISGSAGTVGDGFNIGIGYSALQSVSSGLRNVGLGYRSGFVMSTGGNNVLIGHQAGYNTKLNSNVAIGTDALYNNASGSNNVAVGRQALYNAGTNSTAAGVGGTNVGIGGNAGTIVYSGVYNVYIGYDSGTPNSGTPIGSGSYCTFVGGYSAVVGSNGDSGDYNTGLGYASFGYDGSGNVLEKPGSRNTGLGVFTLPRLSSSLATRNTAVGANAGQATTTGGYNTYVGASAGNDVTTGSYNLMLGWNAGDGITTGVNNTIIGSISGLTSTLSDTIILAAGTTERMRINSSGYMGIGTTNPSYPIHVTTNAGGTSIYASNDIVAFSDRSVKGDIKNIENALDKVQQINGVTFVRTDNNDNIRRAGVIAQEIEAVLPEVVATNPDGTKAVAYGNLNALLIEAIKELSKKVEDLENQLKNK